ncbi:YybH family protein [Marinobacter lacisalsi]|uniref:YybH family protein n=1 Tax=Marinobacter lacisalsi TaxID=475979 RepID=A0ABV8QCQ1_9GAMM
MSSDEDEIRELVAKWMKATKEGDSETVLGLMADDATFIVPGQPPFGKEAFASASKSQDAASMEIDGESEVLEITVSGEWAFMLSHLTVKVKVEGSPEMVRAGNTLTVLTKRDGRWLLFRDANLLVPEQQSGNAT